MMLRKFKIEQSNERIVGNGGLALVGAILSELNLDIRLNNIKVMGGDPKITNADVVKAYMGLLCQGRTAYEDIELYRDDRFFCDVLGIKRLPSCSTLRQRLDKAEGKDDKTVITAGDIYKYLGAKKFFSETVLRITRPGIATGLSWTSVGGEIIFIEASQMPGKGNLILTGQLGDIMKESARAALTFIRSQSEIFGIDKNFYEKSEKRK